MRRPRHSNRARRPIDLGDKLDRPGRAMRVDVHSLDDGR
jgi:hypothetical protein